LVFLLFDYVIFKNEGTQMKTISLRHFTTSLLFSFSLLISLISVSGTAEAFCCPQVYTVQLLPVDPTVRPRLSGYAEINECLGMSFLRIVIRGNTPDGTQLIPTIPGRQPLIGEWFTMTSHRGETVWQNITTYGVLAGGLAGRVIEIDDFNFNPVLTGTF
jgi:hypothetical protein